jgi:hypothetical protein
MREWRWRGIRSIGGSAGLAASAQCPGAVLRGGRVLHGVRYAVRDLRRQPTDEQELDAMISAIQTADLQCIRYRGTDRKVRRRLVELGQGRSVTN